MNRIKDHLIKLLGGFTAHEKEVFAQSCEDFALEHMRIYSHDTCIIKSKSVVRNTTIKGTLQIAPWCLNVRLENLTFKESK